MRPSINDIKLIQVKAPASALEMIVITAGGSPIYQNGSEGPFQCRKSCMPRSRTKTPGVWLMRNTYVLWHSLEQREGPASRRSSATRKIQSDVLRKYLSTTFIGNDKRALSYSISPKLSLTFCKAEILFVNPRKATQMSINWIN